MNSQGVVYVGLSGGVDSAVSAALLKEGGYDVTGVFIKIWQPEFIECTWERDRLDAMRVAAHLSIPFREIDLSDEYKKLVVEEMIAGYARGETPNPDTLCNKHIKFGSFFDWARTEGADFVATGHYASISNDGVTNSVMTELRTPSFSRLLRGTDAGKDQSYFLYTLTQEHLAHMLFPVGAMKKSEVRRLAKRMQLPVAHKPDSQGLCFVGNVSVREFLSRYITVERGVVVDMEGRVVGEHEGAALYTIGQRHGFLHFDTHGAPQYIVGIDTVHNTIRVSPHRADATVSNIIVRDPHWISSHEDTQCVQSVQVRYRETPSPCTVSRVLDGIAVTLLRPCVAACGQAAVFYNGYECLGGGVIDTVIKNGTPQVSRVPLDTCEVP